MAMYDKKTGKEIRPFGYELIGEGSKKGSIVKPSPILVSDQDYGADPIGNGMFRMVPSGDIVDCAERKRRLTRG